MTQSLPPPPSCLFGGELFSPSQSKEKSPLTADPKSEMFDLWGSVSLTLDQQLSATSARLSLVMVNGG